MANFKMHSKLKTQNTDLEKMFVKDISDKGFISEYVKNVKTNNPILKKKKKGNHFCKTKSYKDWLPNNVNVFKLY